MSITIDNLSLLNVLPREGQRVLQIAAGVWVPVGMGGATYALSSNIYQSSYSDSLSN